MRNTANISQAPVIAFGEGCSEELGIRVKQLGCNRVICVTDNGLVAAGIVDRCVRSLREEGIEAIIFDKILPDPTDLIIEECARIAKEERVDGIIGLGGGSCLDVAKSVNVLLDNPPPISRYYGPGNPMKPGKPLVLVPTTSGTGSEVTPISVVADTKVGRKFGVIGPNCVATLAIVDPLLTIGLPASITASTGMDAFSHAAEALTSGLHNPISGTLAERSISLIARSLITVVKNGTDLKARADLSLASLLAGIAFKDALVHYGHAVGHTIGAIYHVPHGTGCVVALPEIIEFVADVVPDQVKILGTAMSLPMDEVGPMEAGPIVAKAIKDFGKSVGIKTIADLKIERSSLDDLAEEVLKDACAEFTPKQASPAEMAQILKKAYDSAMAN